jgi:phage terminase small subunit
MRKSTKKKKTATLQLTPKQEKFAAKYVECGNATKAYRYSYDCSNKKPATVNRLAKYNLDNVKIATRIKELQEVTAQKLLVSDKSVLREFVRIATADIRNIFDEDGNLLPIHEIDKDTARAISNIKVVTRNGKVVEYVHNIKFNNKVHALDSLAKHLGLFERDNLQKGQGMMSVAEAIEAARKEAMTDPGEATVPLLDNNTGGDDTAEK